jgi:hypothetical protein
MMNTTRVETPAPSTTALGLYEAEVALHIAHQTGVDCWIQAAADRLHEALEAHLQAVNVQPTAA